MRNAPLVRSVPPFDVVAAARAVAPAVRARAGAVDAAAAYPADDIAALAAAGLLVAPFACFAADTLRTVLTTIGAASLTVGRLYEGHVNAVALVRRFGDAAALAILADEAHAGRPSGVWNAERGGGLVAHRDGPGWRLHGRKVHCSGAGSLRRPLVTARVDGDDTPTLFLPDMTAVGVAIDLGVWRASGMRGTATGTVVCDGLFVPDAAVVGSPGDYYRSPWFSGGAWRVLAVQLGGLDAVMALHAARLKASGRDRDPVMRARFARAAGAHEAVRLMVAEAAARAEAPGDTTGDAPRDSSAIDAYVDLARGHFEEVALGVIEATRRNVGLGAYIAPDPLDRCLRDLDTYLRQPFLDTSRDHAAGWLLEQEPE